MNMVEAIANFPRLSTHETPRGLLVVGDTQVFFLAVCQSCEPALPMPFQTAQQRAIWCDEHCAATQHTVKFGLEIR